MVQGLGGLGGGDSYYETHNGEEGCQAGSGETGEIVAQIQRSTV